MEDCPPKANPPGWRRPGVVFAALLVLSATVRLPGLGQSFWYDEIISMFLFFRAPWETIVTEMPIPNNHPLYSLMGKACLEIFGEKEWVLRLPAFFLGVFTPPLAYLFGKKWIGEVEGAIAGLFAALSASLVWLSQDARGYSGMVLLTLVCSGLFLDLAGQFRPGRGAAYVLTGAAAIYIQMFAGAVIAAHFLIAAGLLLRRGRGGAWLLAAPVAALGLAFLLYLPMLPDFLAYLEERAINNAGREMSARFLARVFAAWTGGAARPWLSLIFAVPALAGLLVISLRRPLVMAVFVVPFILAAAVIGMGGFFVFERFFTFSLPGLYLFAAAGLAGPLQRSGRGAGAVFLVAAVLVLLVALRDYHIYGKQAIRPAAEFVRREMPGSMTFSAGLLAEVYGYYDPQALLLNKNGVLPEKNLRRAAVVLSYPWSIGEANRNILRRSCRLAREWPSAAGPELAVLVYQCH